MAALAMAQNTFQPSGHPFQLSGHHFQLSGHHFHLWMSPVEVTWLGAKPLLITNPIPSYKLVTYQLLTHLHTVTNARLLIFDIRTKKVRGFHLEATKRKKVFILKINDCAGKIVRSLDGSVSNWLCNWISNW